MKNRFFRIGSEAIWVLVGQVGVAIGGLLSIKIITYLLNPYEFGRFSIANTVILLLAANVFGPFGQGFMRYWSIAQNKNELTDYISTSNKYIKILLYFSFLLSFLIGLTIFVSRWRDWTWIIVLAVISGAFAGWAGIRLSILVAARKRKYVSIINVLTALAKPISAAGLVFFITLKAEIALLGLLIVSCGSAIFTELRFRKTVDNRLSDLKLKAINAYDGDLGRDILSFSYPFFIWSLFAWAHQSCDRWALLTFQGTDAVGAYTVIAQLAFYPLVFGSGLLSNFFVPIAYERAGKLRSKDGVNSANKILLAMVCLYATGSIILILVYYLFNRQLVLLISNENYVQYAYLLPMLTGAWSLYYLGQVLSGFGFLANKPKIYIKPIIFSGVLTTVATFYLASKSGILGIIWALGITGLFYAGWCLLIARRLIVSPKVI